MEKTKRHPHLQAETVDYVVNSEFSQESQAHIAEAQEIINGEFQETWNMPGESLHITLMDWLAPFTDYPKPVDELYRELSMEYVSTLRNILESVEPFTVHFNEIFASDTTVAIKGDDGGVYNRIREQFLDKVELISGTKPPPNIVHSSIIRFTGSCDKKKVDRLLEGINIDFVQEVDEFRVVRETLAPMLEYEIIEKIKL